MTLTKHFVYDLTVSHLMMNWAYSYSSECWDLRYV